MTLLNLRLTRRRIVQALVVLGGGSEPVGAAEARRSWDRSDLGDPIQAAVGEKRAVWARLPATPELPALTRTGLEPINETRIFYAQFGAGPPVVFLHGGMANSNYWGHQIEHLARGHLVTVMDTRGHGRSPVTSREFSYGVFAQDAIALMDFLKIPKAAIIGWSDGAVTGLQLAMKYPERVSRLFAFGGNSAPDGMIANGSRAQTFVTYANRCRSEYSALSPHPERWRTLVDGLRAMWRSEPNFTEADLSAIKASATISDGDHDEIIKRGDTERMARTITRARLVIQTGVSHFAMLQNPGQFNAALDDFLKGPAAPQ